MLCDLAEIYHIYDYKSYPMTYIATLCCGFPHNSRTIKKMNNQTLNLEDLLLANIVDRLSLIWWSKTIDGQKGANRPELITGQLGNGETRSKQMAFNSSEDFETKRRQIIEDKKNGRRGRNC